MRHCSRGLDHTKHSIQGLVCQHDLFQAESWTYYYHEPRHLRNEAVVVPYPKHAVVLRGPMTDMMRTSLVLKLRITCLLPDEATD